MQEGIFEENTHVVCLGKLARNEVKNVLGELKARWTLQKEKPMHLKRYDRNYPK